MVDLHHWCPHLLSIRKSVEMLRWKETFEEVTHPDEQVEILNEVLLNICSNFIPEPAKENKASPGTLDYSLNKKVF